MGVFKMGVGVSVFKMMDRVASLTRHPSKHWKEKGSYVDISGRTSGGQRP